jgi:thymidylate synthase ThyX
VKVGHDHMVFPQSLKDDRRFERAVVKMVETYLRFVEAGVEIENARYILPLCTKTSLFISCSKGP